MKSLAIKLSTWAIVLGVLFLAIGINDIYKERNVSTEATPMQSTNITDPGDSLVYAEISGGRLDILNTYEYSLTTKKSDAKLSSDYFTPIVDVDEGTVLYILKTSLEPNLENITKEAVYSGLLQSKSELPEDILTAYNKSFPNSNFVYLDATYKPETLIEKLKSLAIFFYILVGGLIVRFALRSKKPAPEATQQENPA